MPHPKGKRRSSILKMRQTSVDTVVTDEVEKVSGGKTRRRVSFHNTRTVQFFDGQEMVRSPQKEPVCHDITGSDVTGNSSKMSISGLSTPTPKSTAQNMTATRETGFGASGSGPFMIENSVTDMSISVIQMDDASNVGDNTLDLFAQPSNVPSRAAPSFTPLPHPPTLTSCQQLDDSRVFFEADADLTSKLFASVVTPVTSMLPPQPQHDTSAMNISVTPGASFEGDNTMLIFGPGKSGTATYNQREEFNKTSNATMTMDISEMNVSEAPDNANRTVTLASPSNPNSETNGGFNPDSTRLLFSSTNRSRPVPVDPVPIHENNDVTGACDRTQVLFQKNNGNEMRRNRDTSVVCDKTQALFQMHNNGDETRKNFHPVSCHELLRVDFIVRPFQDSVMDVTYTASPEISLPKDEQRNVDHTMMIFESGRAASGEEIKDGDRTMLLFGNNHASKPSNTPTADRTMQIFSGKTHPTTTESDLREHQNEYLSYIEKKTAELVVADDSVIMDVTGTTMPNQSMSTTLTLPLEPQPVVVHQVRSAGKLREAGSPMAVAKKKSKRLNRTDDIVIVDTTIRKEQETTGYGNVTNTACDGGDVEGEVDKSLVREGEDNHYKEDMGIEHLEAERGTCTHFGNTTIGNRTFIDESAPLLGDISKNSMLSRAPNVSQRKSSLVQNVRDDSFSVAPQPLEKYEMANTTVTVGQASDSRETSHTADVSAVSGNTSRRPKRTSLLAAAILEMSYVSRGSGSVTSLDSSALSSFRPTFFALDDHKAHIPYMDGKDLSGIGKILADKLRDEMEAKRVSAEMVRDQTLTMFREEGDHAVANAILKMSSRQLSAKNPVYEELFVSARDETLAEFYELRQKVAETGLQLVKERVKEIDPKYEQRKQELEELKELETLRKEVAELETRLEPLQHYDPSKVDELISDSSEDAVREWRLRRLKAKHRAHSIYTEWLNKEMVDIKREDAEWFALDDRFRQNRQRLLERLRGGERGLDAQRDEEQGENMEE